MRTSKLPADGDQCNLVFCSAQASVDSSVVVSEEDHSNKRPLAAEIRAGLAGRLYAGRSVGIHALVRRARLIVGRIPPITGRIHSPMIDTTRPRPSNPATFGAPALL